ncbi:MAG: Xaa-Pro peptidase family protein [Nocardioides sp.]|uniref:M24 family metallopeptidase n=1 Tax=Nocardioides sp. TaxID=35761 RepID=UPI0039E3F09D
MPRLLVENGLDGFLATSPEHVTYLTGYHSWTIYTFSAMEVYAVIAASGEKALVVPVDALDFLVDRPADVDRVHVYGTFHIAWRAGTTLDGAERRLGQMRADLPHHPSARAALISALRELGLLNGRLGIDETGLTPPRWRALAETLPEAQLTERADLLRRARVCKADSEVELLRYAALAVEAGIQTAFAGCSAGDREVDLERVIQSATAAAGVIPGHCETSLGTRSSACFPATDRRLGPGDVIRSDCGGRYRGYWADTGRTAVLGDPPPVLKRCFDAISTGIDAMLVAIRPGLKVADLFDVAVGTVRDAGIPDYRRHHVGHGIGLEMYEAPLLVGATGSADIHVAAPTPELVEGMVLNIELPYYELGLGGVQIEETLVVRSGGYDLLTSAPRGLFTVEADSVH